VARKPNPARDLAEKYGYQTGGPAIPGNLDLHNRPVVHNADASISTVRSITVGFGNKTYVLPTVIGDKVVSNKEAIDHFKKTGEHLGAFDTLADAEGYSQRLHEDQGEEYKGKAMGGLAEKYGVEGYAKGGTKKPTDIELAVQKLTHMKPGVERPQGLLPLPFPQKDGKDPWTMPQFAYDLAKAFVTPGVAAQGGSYDTGDVVNMAMNVTGGGLGASHVAGPTLRPGQHVLGMGVKPKAAVKDVEKLAAKYDVEASKAPKVPKAPKAPPPAVMTEVAPGQKWNATQKHEWEKLHPEAKASISNKIVEEFLPRWKRETGVEGNMVSGLGGYEGASNPNFIFRPKDPADVTKAVHGLGDLLRQDAMMAADIRPFENSSPSGVARVKLPPNVTEDQAHQVYSQLNKAGLAEGHTTDLGQGYMDILAGPGGAKTAAIRDDIAKQLNARYDVDSYDANVAFPDKGDGYGRRTSPVEPPGSSIQLGPQVLQSEAADRLEGYLREAADQGYGHKGPVTLGGLADRYNVKSGTSALPLNKADSPYMVSTRRPSASNYAAQGNPNIDLLTQSGEALRNTPGTFEKAMKLLAEEPYMSGANTTDPELLLKYGVDQGADNLSFIVNDLMSPTDVDYARRFYPAAHAEAKNAALKTGFPEQVGYGVTATTSPQTPWDINVARMSRLLNMHTSDYATDPKAVMKWVADRRAAAKNPSELGSIASMPDDWLMRVAETPMADLPVDGFERYAKVFMSDLSQNAPTVKRFLAPGEYGDDFGKMTWGNSDIVNKSLNIMNDPSMANITEQMLGGGKVPTFFNHVANPYSKVPMATMDTHSAGAFSLFPGGGKDPVVYRTMGLSPSTGLPQAAPNSARTGTKGYYGVAADAHALAGERLGMLPAEAQAAPWGGVRTLWGEGLKTPELKKQVESIWRTAPSPDAARRAIAELLGRPVRRMFAVKPTRRE